MRFQLFVLQYAEVAGSGVARNFRGGGHRGHCFFVAAQVFFSPFRSY